MLPSIESLTVTLSTWAFSMLYNSPLDILNKLCCADM
jgi:hypothetical protein